MWIARALLVTFAILPACTAPSTEDLDVHGTISNGGVTFSSVTAPRLKAAWTLSLDLGELASSASDVTQINFQLVETNNAAEPVPMPLSAMSTTSMHVDPGHQQKIEYNFDSAAGGGMQLQPTVNRLCSGSWAITGSFFDGARQKTTPMQGPPVSVVCCTSAMQPGCS